MVLHGIDSATNVARPIQQTNQKLHIRGSELETKLDNINTTLSTLNVSVGDVDVNTDGLETLVTTSNTSLSAIESSVHQHSPAPITNGICKQQRKQAIVAYGNRRLIRLGCSCLNGPVTRR